MESGIQFGVHLFLVAHDVLSMDLRLLWQDKSENTVKVRADTDRLFS